MLNTNENHQSTLRLEKLLRESGVTEHWQSDDSDEEQEDIDGFLRMFTNTQAWVQLSEFSNDAQ